MKGIDHAGSIFLRSVVRRMKQLGLSQSELARRMHAARPYVIKVLKGGVNITLGSAARFAKALEMDFFPTLTPKKKRGKTDATDVPREEIATAALSPVEKGRIS